MIYFSSKQSKGVNKTLKYFMYVPMYTHYIHKDHTKAMKAAMESNSQNFWALPHHRRSLWLSLLGKLTNSTGWFSYSIHSHCICNGLYFHYRHVSELKMREREIPNICLTRRHNPSNRHCIQMF